ncbi:MAG: IS21-like element helper ATPase IstB [Archangium sp.]|nr:IS21-like element helper ATPase IstB [Archangium sp.]
MSPTDELARLLKKLRLSGVLQTLDLRMKQAVDDNLAMSEFLFRLLADEVERRDSRQLTARLRRANFEHARTLEDFDFTFNASVPKAKVLELATCAFVERRDNVLIIGPTGVGKSHLAQALGHRACRAGSNVLYLGAHELLAQLRASRADASFEKRLLRFTSPDVLIIDDLGLRGLNADESGDLYEVVRARYERGSTIITSNRAIEEWPPLFGNPLLASAAMDRLLHHAHVLVIEGDSYRNPPTTKRRKPAQAEAR